MKRKLKFVPLALLVLLLALSPSHTTTAAQTGGGYDLSWNTVDGGGATFSTGGAYSLGGTTGQADAGAMSGGSYSLAGGFWPSEIEIRLFLDFYLPLIVR